jgi:nitrite reductase/ring-hydroxylating ferredoxin subunit
MAAQKTFVCITKDVTPGAAHIVKIRNFSVGVFRIGDGYHALLNVCPHRGAAICEGPVCGTTAPTGKAEFIYHREGEIIRCAWHGWEFDIRTGVSLVDPQVKARTFPVTVEDDKIYVHA